MVSMVPVCQLCQSYTKRQSEAWCHLYEFCKARFCPEIIYFLVGITINLDKKYIQETFINPQSDLGINISQQARTLATNGDFSLAQHEVEQMLRQTQGLNLKAPHL